MVKKKVKSSALNNRVVSKRKFKNKDISKTLNKKNTISNNYSRTNFINNSANTLIKSSNNINNLSNENKLDSIDKNKVILFDVESQIAKSDKTLSNVSKFSDINAKSSLANQVPTFSKSDKSDNTDGGDSVLRLVGVGIGVCILLFWLAVIFYSVTIYTGPKVVERNVTILYYEPIKSSFERFIVINDTSYVENVSLVGYIRKEAINNSNTMKNVTYVVDINQNKIPLFLTSEQIIEYDALFIDSNPNLRVYLINGIYHYNSGEFIISVVNITSIGDVSFNGKKFLREVRKQQMENMTEGEEKPGISFNLEKGIMKMFSILG
jgi:hypothetical protein